MTVNPDTLNPNNPPSGNPPATPPATPPGQQTGDTGQGGTQTPPSTPPATGQGQQTGSSEGGSDTSIQISKTDMEARIEQAKRSGVRELLSAMGFEHLDDPDRLKQAQTDLGDLITYAREQKRAAMNAEEQVKADLQTAKDDAQSEKTAREKAERERDAATANLRDFILRSTIIEAAADAAHPSDVYDLYAKVFQKDKLADVIKSDVPLFGEDGTFDPKAIDQKAVNSIIDKCKEERAEWWGTGIFRRTPGSPSNAGATPPTGDQAKQERMKELARQNLTSL